MATDYDSRQDTLDHIEKVRWYLQEVREELHARALTHDASKLVPPEVEIFDRVTPKFKGLTYGSDEYKAVLAEMGEGLAHHYAHNSHHPEHFENGINGMSLLDILEMLCDHKAASERHANGDLWKSMQINRERFRYSDQLYEILCNTVREMGW